jgi:hypothetical protein
MGFSSLAIRIHLVIIDDLHLVGIAVIPDEADAPLVVDADAVLSFAVALECFESVAGGDLRSSSFTARCKKSSLRRATRSIFRKRGTSTSLNKASVSLQRNDWIMRGNYYGLRNISSFSVIPVSRGAESAMPKCN